VRPARERRAAPPDRFDRDVYDFRVLHTAAVGGRYVAAHVADQLYPAAARDRNSCHVDSSLRGLEHVLRVAGVVQLPASAAAGARAGGVAGSPHRSQEKADPQSGNVGNKTSTRMVCKTVIR
jgi:hypothetical protein